MFEVVEECRFEVGEEYRFAVGEEYMFVEEGAHMFEEEGARRLKMVGMVKSWERRMRVASKVVESKVVESI